MTQIVDVNGIYTHGYSTYLGGNEDDWGYAIAVDGAGNAYVTGNTESADFPTANPLQPANAGEADTFVAKLDPAGSALVYSTYLGGSSGDYGNGIAVDAAGNSFVTGFTESTDFPTANPLQPAYSGGNDAFVAKLDPAGSALVFSTYLGGSVEDYGFAVAVDGAGSPYVTGYTYTRIYIYILSNNFPTANPLQPAFAYPSDAFVAKLDPDGSALAYSTFLGGSNGDDEGHAIAVDGAGNAYVVGTTESTAATFPVAVGPDLTLNGDYDAFVARVDATGTGLVYAGYIGGSSDD